MRRCPQCSTVFPDEVAFCGNDGTITIEVQDPSDTDPRLGQRLGDYLVVARIADGAMGRVFEGRHWQTKARVAVKVLHEHVANDKVAVERFKREAETAREVTHPHVVQVIDFGQTPDSRYFMTMEYLKGEELGDLLRRGQPIPMERVVRILCQAALALNHAHSFGVIHRDLKPDNIFLVDTPDGDVVKLLDFGSVKLQMEMGPKLTAFGTTLGSPYYMSPEQAMGKDDIDQRTDVYALGAILYEMLTNKIAFDAPSVAHILMRILNESPTPPNTVNPRLPASLNDVMDAALKKDKNARYPSAEALADGFCAALGLQGGAKQWAQAPKAVIAQALATARPPASVAPPVVAAAAGKPAARKSAPDRPGAQPGTDDTWRPPSSSVSPALIVVIVVGGLFVLGAIGAAVLLKVL